jgi:hypothetical protein
MRHPLPGVRPQLDLRSTPRNRQNIREAQMPAINDNHHATPLTSDLKYRPVRQC